MKRKKSEKTIPPSRKAHRILLVTFTSLSTITPWTCALTTQSFAQPSDQESEMHWIGNEDAGLKNSKASHDNFSTSRPKRNTPTSPLRIAVISDLNGHYGATYHEKPVHQSIDRILQLKPDIVISTGDMVAGQQSRLPYHHMWLAFHNAVSDRLEKANIPFAITPGNHDASAYPLFSTEREVFLAEWHTRKPDLNYIDAKHFPLRYSFALRNTLFISLDATVVGSLPAEQMSWLQTQLEQGAHLPVKIIYGHVPLAPFTQGRETEIIGDSRLEKLLLLHNVDLWISGHHHAYYPGRRDALRIVSTSCLGAGPRRLIGSNKKSSRSLLWIETTQQGITVLEALSGAAFKEIIQRDTLPVHIGKEPWKIFRDDTGKNPIPYLPPFSI